MILGWQFGASSRLGVVDIGLAMGIGETMKRGEVKHKILVCFLTPLTTLYICCQKSNKSHFFESSKEHQTFHFLLLMLLGFFVCVSS